MAHQTDGSSPREQRLPLLPLRRGVILPHSVTPVPVGRPRSRALARLLEPGDELLLAVQYDDGVESPAIADLHPVAVRARLKDKRRQGPRALLVVETLGRVALSAVSPREDHWEAAFEEVEETQSHSDESVLLAESLRTLVVDSTEDENLAALLRETTGPGALADRVAMVIDVPQARKAEVLRALDVEARLRLVAELFTEARARVELQERIDSEVRKGLSEQQREVLLRQQLRAIQKELGRGEGGGDPLEELEAKLEAADLPDEVREVAERELGRLQSMQGAGPESNVIRSYLEWILALPWNERSDTHQDIDGIARALDADHYGLDEVKQRILEHMAVMKLSPKARGTILALVGPPGVGKTSLAQSIAQATGRPLARVSLGGVRDEAEVRGHRRTYVGALPGRIIHAVRKAGAKNPVLVLDEIDKLGRGWAGDPEAALLEVLDPEQNATFTDHYLELPFDLSEVLFIATANELSTLSPPLRDRLEIIEVQGYTLDEKLHIGRDHLWPKQLDDHGLEPEKVTIDDETLRVVVQEYTREAGVRRLTRELAKVCRSVALEVARGGAEEVVVDVTRARSILGRPRYLDEPAERLRPPGVAAGLAWTPVGGDVLYVETTLMPGKGKLEITGKLGEVMNESARAALAYLRSHADELEVDASFLERSDLHIHVPAGAVPKDGPSAGVTMFTALASLLTGRRVDPDLAMTGEVTLRGRVLPVGGIKSKVLAAHRVGFSRLVIPKGNERDLDDIPEAIRGELDIVLAEDMHDVLAAALVDEEVEDGPLMARPRPSMGAPAAPPPA